MTTLSRCKILGLLGLALLPCSGVAAQAVLNEILAVNTTTIANGDGFPDCIELGNPSAQPLDLGGLSLTDDLSVPRKFVFPTNTIVPAGGFLLVWCDSDTSAPGLHTGFALSAAGESVGLYDTNSTLLDSLVFGVQAPDLSVGRVPDFTGGWALTVPTPAATNVVQPLGPGAALRFNEWLANATPEADWFEIYNPTNLPVALAGLVFTDLSGTPPPNRAVPALSFIGGNGFVQFFADDLADPGADHVDFKLSSTSGETLRLYAANRSTVLDTVTFGPQTLNVSQGRLPDGGTNIVFFRANEATPAESNFSAITNVVINELLSHADPPYEDAVELFNPTSQAVDVSHWWLSDNANNPQRYRISAGTVIPAGGFKVLYQYQFDSNGLGFAYGSYESGEVVLCTGNAAGQLTGDRLQQAFGAADNGVSFTRFVTSRGVEFVAASRPTFGVDNPANLADFRSGTGQSNAYPRIGPVILNEVMYHPPDLLVGGVPVDNTEDEFIELWNVTNAVTPLYDPLHATNRWQLRNGVSFEFPAGLTLSNWSYLLVVSFDPTNTATLASFRAKYDVPANVMIVGPFSGRLSNRGETIELLKPDAPQQAGQPKPGLVPYILVDRLAYEDRAPWPASPDGGGNSLQRRSAVVHGNDPVHWLGTAATAGRANTIERPRIDLPARAAGGEFTFQFSALAGVAYIAEWLADPSGTPTTLINITAATESRVIPVVDYGARSNGVARYYRLRMPPQP